MHLLPIILLVATVQARPPAPVDSSASSLSKRAPQYWGVPPITLPGGGGGGGVHDQSSTQKKPIVPIPGTDPPNLRVYLVKPGARGPHRMLDGTLLPNCGLWVRETLDAPRATFLFPNPKTQRWERHEADWPKEGVGIRAGHFEPAAWTPAPGQATSRVEQIMDAHHFLKPLGGKVEFTWCQLVSRGLRRAWFQAKPRALHLSANMAAGVMEGGMFVAAMPVAAAAMAVPKMLEKWRNRKDRAEWEAEQRGAAAGKLSTAVQSGVQQVEEDATQLRRKNSGRKLVGPRIR